MAKIIDHEQYRNDLLEGVVRAAAKYDLGGVTNQTIAEMSSQSEPYIYRYFVDRDDLICKAFFRCDENFFAELNKNSPILFDESLSQEERFVKFMNCSWNFMVDDYDYCKFYIRYYYSNANTPEFREQHNKIAYRFYEKVKCFFTEGTDVDKIMHMLFSGVIWNVMDCALGMEQDTPETRNNLFRMMFGLIKKYLKRSVDNEKVG